MQETVNTSIRKIAPPHSFERTAWKWMRYSGALIIPLAFIHILIQDVIVGVHNIDINYVEARWSLIGWRIYDAFLLVFAFTHGVNGLRQVLLDFIHVDRLRRLVNLLLFIFWIVISLAGAAALVAGVRR
jgi:succinate dehydrogenase / fumarate reductase membrane anchor subunit